jgi:Cu(I)/Ag(I) efflux system membrane fusion protein
MDHHLKVNSLIRATIQTGKASGLWIPGAAISDLGRTQVVWLKKGALYTAHQVFTGVTSGNHVLIRKGLSQTDSLAANARYLTDSESFIKIRGNE